MKFPPAFQFSQGNLQDFNECRRRFYLHHIRQLAWPAVESEPQLENERLMQQGASFHRLAQQFFLGVPPDTLSKQAVQEPLAGWWWNFLAHQSTLPGLTDPKARKLPEISLTSMESGYRLIAKYDLLVFSPEGSIVIYDWKTSSQKRPRRKWLAERLQTRLYRYMLVSAGRKFKNKVIQPSQVKMIYWFTGFPNDPEIFTYSDAQFAEDERYLRQLIQTIANLVTNDSTDAPGEGFPLTLEEKRCAFCIYRSLCDRGVQAGNLLDLAAESVFSAGELELTGLDFNLEQIAEIEY